MARGSWTIGAHAVDHLIAPVGGRLTPARVAAQERDAVWTAAVAWPTLPVDGPALAALELLADGALSPLAGFPAPDGADPPIWFPCPADQPLGPVALRGPTHHLQATLTIDTVFTGPDGPCAAGAVRVLTVAAQPTPAEVRQRLAARTAGPVLAVVADRLLDEHDEEFLREQAAGAALLFLLPTEPNSAGDLHWYARRLAAQTIAARLGAEFAPVADHPLLGAGDRPAWWARIARNYGADRLVVELADRRQPQSLSPDSCCGVALLAAPPLAAVPRWPAEVADFLATAAPPRERQGVCLWLTGLPSAGKSTIAEELVPQLLAHGRPVTLLDGDVVRTHLSKGLGFSRDDRDTNIRRIGFVASQIVRHHGWVVVAAVSPYDATRREVEAMVGADQFVLCHVATPLDVCEQRDAKGLYALARQGKITGFTGVDDPYEPPTGATVVLDTVGHDAVANAATVMAALRARGLLRR